VQSAGLTTQCHLVGGALRDHYLGRSSADFDVVVAGDGRQIAERVAQETSTRLVTLGADRFASFRLIGGDHILDLWDREGMSLGEDLARRDFTINSLALDLRSGELLDPLNGLEDLAKRRLRSTSDLSFLEDPLRVMRLARFSLELSDFAIDSRTMKAARACADGLAGTAPERIRVELDAILGHREVDRAVEMLADLRLFPGLWLGTPGGSCNLGDTLLRLRLLKGSLDELVRVLENLPDQLDRRTCVHATVMDCAAALGNTSPGTLCSSARSRGLLTTRLARRVHRSLTCEQLPTSGREERLFLATWGAHWTDPLGFRGSKAFTDRQSSDLRSLARRLAALVELDRAVLSPRPLLNGHEVKKLLDLAPGPSVGRALDELLLAQMAGTVTNRAEAERFLRARRTLLRADVSPTATSCRRGDAG
jgi:tRNA nucleotidyltransferase/poly(A) polymerase